MTTFQPEALPGQSSQQAASYLKRVGVNENKIDVTVRDHSHRWQ